MLSPSLARQRRYRSSESFGAGREGYLIEAVFGSQPVGYLYRTRALRLPGMPNTGSLVSEKASAC
jgi:hypothetical protein